ncbi:MAG: peptidylprolyl isomerase [Pyrinomonadaceae bacterium]|nr:peptidylprolyl isomerase [Pyrinomonadaceae bacterium]
MTLALVPFRRVFCAALFVFAILFITAGEVHAQRRAAALRSSTPSVPQNILLQIVRAEDERRWDADLSGLLSEKNAAVRARAALAAGRIGDERAVPSLVALLQQDKENAVRAMAAFALGETEAASAVEALITELIPARPPAELNARIMEALGKIIAALPKVEGEKARSAGEAILGMLNFEHKYKVNPDRQIVLLGLTAVLRARPEGAGKVLAQFLASSDPRVRADAANALARLRAKDGNEQLRKLLTTDPDPIVRANAARVLGATEEKAAFDSLLERALSDEDSRVRVSAVRSLGALKDARAIEAFVTRAKQILAPTVSNELPVRKGRQRLRSSPGLARPAETNELLEIAAALGRIAENTRSRSAYELVDMARAAEGQDAPELEIAKARIAPQLYSIDLQRTRSVNVKASTDKWRVLSAMAQGAAVLASVKTDSPLLDSSIKNEAIRNLSQMISCPRNPEPIEAAPVRVRADAVLTVRCTPISVLALPDWLRAYAAFKQSGTDEIMRKHLTERDVVVRATAAELLGELPPDERNTRALADALPAALRDKVSNDAALAILEALDKQKSTAANDAIKLALESQDDLIRRRAVELLKASGAGDFASRIGTLQTRNTVVDYKRAMSRIGLNVQAIVSTNKGSFTIELLPEEAPLNVDNFVQLARRRYFNGISFHRVVPNFVIQGGDPRGDGNGGPGYQIRCEINLAPFERGAVGMALSGKDTGGSQWFVTHSPQPHLDGGYTVFGRVVTGMDVVDRITRWDVIRSVVITEGPRSVSKP